MTGKGSDISGKGGAAMSMWLKLNNHETGTEVCYCNFTNMIEQGNGDESTAGRLWEAQPVKAASLVGSVIVSELKKFDQKNRIRMKGY